MCVISECVSEYREIKKAPVGVQYGASTVQESEIKSE